jgi:hypothetical protein
VPRALHRLQNVEKNTIHHPHEALQICSNYSPDSKSHKQPYTSFIGAGFSYKLSKFSEEELEKSAATGYIHPKQWIQVGYISNLLGYGVNNAISGI